MSPHRPPLSPETVEIVSRLFDRYCLHSVPARLEPNTRENWVLHMIHAVYSDWFENRLSDEQFANLVDRIFTS